MSTRIDAKAVAAEQRRRRNLRAMHRLVGAPLRTCTHPHSSLDGCCDEHGGRYETCDLCGTVIA